MDNINLTDLIKRAKEWDQQAIADLYSIGIQKATFTAKMLLKDDDQAEDIVQDAFVKAFESLDSLSDPNKFQPWLDTIVSNKCKNYLKKKKPMLFSELTTTDDDGDETEVDFEDKNEAFIPEANMDLQATKKIVNNMLEELPEDQRMTILLYYMDDLSIKDIAETMNCSEGTVKSRLSRAKDKLRQMTLDIEKRDGIKLHLIPIAGLLGWFFKSQTSSVTAYAMEGAAEAIMVNTTSAGALNIAADTAAESAVTSMASTGSAASATVSTAGTASTAISSVGGTAGSTITAGSATAGTVSAVTSAGGAVAVKTVATGTVVKLIAGLSAAAVIAGGATGVVIHKVSSSNSDNSTIIESTAPADAEIETESSNEQSVMYSAVPYGDILRELDVIQINGLEIDSDDAVVTDMGDCYELSNVKVFVPETFNFSEVAADGSVTVAGQRYVIDLNSAEESGYGWYNYNTSDEFAWMLRNIETDICEISVEDGYDIQKTLNIDTVYISKNCTVELLGGSKVDFVEFCSTDRSVFGGEQSFQQSGFNLLYHSGKLRIQSGAQLESNGYINKLTEKYYP